MALSYGRSPAAMHNSVKLYCAQCESQLGIFDNEWIRLTSSYARSKEKGTHFGTDVGQRTQTVPSGPAQRLAEGCVMAEVFCRKCSNLVGQYCKSVPTIDKQALAHQYFYKLSRTFLKDGRTMARVDPVFGYGSDVVKSTNSRASSVLRMSLAPTSRWADTPLRESSRSPAIAPHDTVFEPRRREQAGSPMNVHTPNDDRWPEVMAEISKLHKETSSQHNLIQAESERSSAQTRRLDAQGAMLSDQSTTIEDHENCLSAQATRIVEQEQQIENQTKRLQEQEMQLSSITNQLVKLQKTMDDLKTTLILSKLSSSSSTPTLRNKTSNTQNTASSEAMAGTAQSTAKELQDLRSENQSIKSKLSAIESAMGIASHVNSSKDMGKGQSSNPPDAESVLGKRKRNEAHRSSLALVHPAAIQRHDPGRSLSDTNQMPTPQSSDGGHPSPEQTPHVVTTGTTRRNPHRKSRNSNPRNASLPRPSDTRQSQRDTDEDSSQQNQNEVVISSLENRSVIELQPSSELPSPVQEHGPRHTGHTSQILANSMLPSVETASNVLGMNLKALIASSQALRQSHGPLIVHSDRMEGTNIQGDETDLRGDLGNEIQTRIKEPRVMDLESNTELSEEVYTDIDFVQDSGVHDLFDTSDDDDDLFHQDPALYGNDSLGCDTIDISTCNDPSMISSGTAVTDRDHRSHSAAHASLVYHGRSMAPEPVTRQKRTRVPRTYISLDKAHIATPQMFADADGQRPAKGKSAAVPNSEQHLNEELIRLGLSEWIGKDKTRRDYREAVSLARARSRNLKKAAFLRSRGLKHDPMEPASTLPEEPRFASPHPAPPQSQIPTVSAGKMVPPPPPSEQVTPSLPVSQTVSREMADLSELTPILSSARTRSASRLRASITSRKSVEQSKPSAPEAQDSSDYIHESESGSERDTRAARSRRTRASTRKVKATSMKDPDELDNQVAMETEAKQLIGLYTTGGSRRSKRRSDMASKEKEIDIDDGIQHSGENGTPQNGRENDSTNVNSNEQLQATVPPNPQILRRGRGRPRKSASPTIVNDDPGESLIDDSAEFQEIGAVSAPTPVTNALQDKTSKAINQAEVIFSPASQARQLEQAIMLRDQMAKALMEQEGMDM